MLTPEQRDLLRRHVHIDGDGNVVGNDNTVRVTKQTAGDYAVQIGEQRVTFNVAELRQVLNIEHSQVGVIGDGTTVYGGINFYQHARPQPVDDATLAAAHERLAALPLDHVPPPATLPSPHRMPLRANSLFVGRERDLAQLTEALKGQAVGTTAPTAAIGKTQLASEFVHRYGPARPLAAADRRGAGARYQPARDVEQGAGRAVAAARCAGPGRERRPAAPTPARPAR